MNNITPIGITNHQSKQLPFGIKDKDRAGHIYCIGKTGTGKSTLLLNMAIHDIEQGKGVGIIDPHGDLAETILNYIPQERIQDVIYFDLTDTNYPIRFNPLYKATDESRYLLAEAIVTTLKKLWIESWGPRLEHILRNTLLSLTYYPNATLIDITKLLTQAAFRREVLAYINNEALHQFWDKEYEPLLPQVKNEVISPIVNKIGLFTTHPVISNILRHKNSTFSIDTVMNTKKIFIANLSKGVLGEAGTQLIGSLLVTQFQTASLRRTKQPEYQRTPFYLYIDEMHSFMTLSFADILSESRKYGLCLYLTHQYMEQLAEPLQKAILGNVGTIISFRVGTLDAVILKDEFYPIFTEEDIITIPQYSIYIKLLIDGTTSPPFSAITYPLPSKTKHYKKLIIEYSRKLHSIYKSKSIVKNPTIRSSQLKELPFFKLTKRNHNKKVDNFQNQLFTGKF